jgi:hypothetical protein
VTSEDFLPKLICTHCTNLVNQFYEFREMCMNTHMRLMQCARSQDSSQVTSTTEVCVYSVTSFLFLSKNADNDRETLG